MSLSPSQRKSTSLRAVDFKRQIEHPGSTFDLSNDESLEIWSALQATGERQSGSFIDMLNTCLRGLVRQGGQVSRQYILDLLLLYNHLCVMTFKSALSLQGSDG